MRCPKCGEETEVIRKQATLRQRRCKNPACAFTFETRENLITGMEFRRLRAGRNEPPSQSP